MKRFITTIALFVCIFATAQPLIESQWEGKRVAFLGDSITDKRQIGSQSNIYWNQLADILGIEPYVYGIAGHRMNQIIGQAKKLEAEHGQAVDAIIVFIGTNDFNGSIPVGEWYSYDVRQTRFNEQAVERRHREMIFDDATFKGRANNTLRWLKTHYPNKQIIFMTPIHRAVYDRGTRYQPTENYANGCGSFIDEYVQAVKELANVWAVPVIDLNSICGLYPLLDEHSHLMRSATQDRLHPNTPGHLRMAYAIAYQLLGYPARIEQYLALSFDNVADKASQTAIRTMLKELGIPASFYGCSKSIADGSEYISEHLDSSAWKLHKPVNLREVSALEGAQDGNILCLDGFDASKDSLETLKTELKTLQDAGYNFVTTTWLIDHMYTGAY